MAIIGYIFDIDHTLLVSDKAHIDAALEAFAKFGITRTYDDVIKYFDKATDEIFRLITGDEYHNPEEIAEEKTRLLNIRIRNNPSIAPLYPKVEEVLSKIKALGGKIGIVSNNFNSVIESIIEAYKWNGIVEGYIGIDDVINRKPHPEMVQKMINKLNLEPKQCAMIGDSVYDIQAGNAAGCFTVGVCTGHFNKNEFREFHPNLVVDEVGDLLKKVPL